MKKIAITTIMSGALAVSAFAQGDISFQASSSLGQIKYATTPGGSNSLATTTIAGYGQTHIGFFSAPNGTVLTLSGGLPVFTTAWTAAAQVLTSIAPGAGNVPLTTVTLANAPASSSVELEIVGWVGTDTSWSEAASDPSALLGYVGSSYSGGSLSWSQGTGNPGATPPVQQVAVVTGSGGYEGLVLEPLATPEPTTIALGGLGAAALLMFRRRK